MNEELNQVPSIILYVSIWTYACTFQDSQSSSQGLKESSIEGCLLDCYWPILTWGVKVKIWFLITYSLDVPRTPMCRYGRPLNFIFLFRPI